MHVARSPLTSTRTSTSRESATHIARHRGGSNREKQQPPRAAFNTNERARSGNAMTCKVDRVRDKYDLYNLDARLEHRYRSTDEGVRQLEDWINCQILERAMEKAGMTVLDGEERNYYRLLTNDEVLDSARREARGELREASVDVDEVESNFVSYQTVRKHLNECLDIDTSRDYNPDPGADLQQIKKMRQRVTNVIEGSLARLSREDVAHIEDPSVTVSFKIRCGNCRRRHDVIEFLSGNATCTCQSEA